MTFTLKDHFDPKPTAGGYTLSATRPGIAGILDKKALIEAMAEKYSADKRLQDIVLRAVRNSPSAADQQLLAWERFLEKIQYRREPGEILRNPVETAELGGDCDDMTLLAISGCLALGIPAMPEVIADSRGQGFHIRCVAMLPPTNPQFTVVIDPVYRSEPEWAMAGRDLGLASAQFRGTTRTLNGTELKSTSPRSEWAGTSTQSGKSEMTLGMKATLLVLVLVLIAVSLPPGWQGD